MAIMTPGSVFVDNTQKPNEDHPQGSTIGATKISTPSPKTPQDIRAAMDSHFSQYPKLEEYYKMMKHYGAVSKSKKDVNDQFGKLLEIYISSLKQVAPSDDQHKELEEIAKTMETTKKLLANFVGDGNIGNDYFKAGLAAMLVNLL